MNRRFFLAGAVTLFFAAMAAVPPAQSQSIVEEKDSSQKKIELRVALLTEKLDLNESQQANLEECLKAALENGKGIRDDATLTDEQKKIAWQSSRKAYRNYIRGLLTGDQLTALEAFLAAAKAPPSPPVGLPDDAADAKDPLFDDLGAAPPAPASPAPAP